MKIQAFFKGGAKAAPAKKSSAPAKKASFGGSARKGWFGGAEQSALDKWYGPDRKLFLPGGLLDRDDLPDYLDGTLPGELLILFRANEARLFFRLLSARVVGARPPLAHTPSS
jgi:hypothetical protein